MWDLKEKLDYATTQKQSLQNYVDYVSDSFAHAFEAGDKEHAFDDGDDDGDGDDGQ